ncbi:MAG: 6-carboxyhexanoate--CoA ligase [Desulfuromonadales bacterium C00003094]|jgi:6-carboxyhexanoate--CoA ligase|nr:MAG: 6-carboxyhexanoate--CoA ligase [Desulfuromonadales bacterium C00003094]OEU72516.1 MAG: 6-carboxyhexanoate--CoA ligase [Desulfuromonadales bacterium C00003107]
MKRPLYSIRMQASRNGHHLSGAEHLSTKAELEPLAASLIKRALEHMRGRAETIQLSIDKVDEAQIGYGVLPDLHTYLVDDYHQGRRAAAAILQKAGVTSAAIEGAMVAMASGAAPDGHNMRGAMLIDAVSGYRLEPDQARGVRVSRMDLTEQARHELTLGLRSLGLDNAHVREALVLAGKVVTAPGVLAELCWSDDPDYTAGYVASAQLGYIRFPHLKPKGEERGGRAFFLAAGEQNLSELIDYLQCKPLLFDHIGQFHRSRQWVEPS